MVDPGSGAIYGEVESIGPGTTQALRVRLGDGVYAFRCLVEDTGAIVGLRAARLVVDLSRSAGVGARDGLLLAE